jgi:hypothetical protein
MALAIDSDAGVFGSIDAGGEQLEHAILLARQSFSIGKSAHDFPAESPLHGAQQLSRGNILGYNRAIIRRHDNGRDRVGR